MALLRARRHRSVTVPAFTHGSDKRAALQLTDPDHAGDGGGGSAGDRERNFAAVGRRRNRFRFHRRDRQKQAADGHDSAPQIKVRASCANTYKPPDAPVRRPSVPLQDAFEPIGLRVGSLLLKPSLDVTRGHDSNPTHQPNGKGSAFTTVEPAVKLQSDWARHEFRADLRGAFSNYDSQSQLNAPLADAKSYARFDVTRDTKINLDSRFFLSTDYPGSPNLPADIAKLPIYTSYGNTLGLTQSFNHLDLTAKASVDRTKYDESKLTDGTTSSNHDRDYSQYAGAARASYEVFPGGQAVRRSWRQHPQARPAVRPQRLSARLAVDHAQGGFDLLDHPQAHRRGLGGVSGAALPGPEFA
jgi:hypothetical protein